jgi:hypothetical protein
MKKKIEKKYGSGVVSGFSPFKKNKNSIDFKFYFYI